jgi:hypothetical protein
VRYRICAAAAAILVSFSGGSAALDSFAGEAGPQYRVHGVPWPGGLVRYYNAAPSQAWAVRKAVAAWNRSGANVRFVATSRAEAQLVIRHDPSVASCNKAEATIGFVPDASVTIFPRSDATQECNRYTAAVFLAHELGHVLGLRHEDRGCATMNAIISYRGGELCDQGMPWQWRCQLLELDDVLGAIAVYGGAPKPQRRSPLCAVYKPIKPPIRAEATYRPEYGGISLEFRRRPDPAAPAFLAPFADASRRGYAYLGLRDECPKPTLTDDVPRHAWPSDTEMVSRVVAQPPPGRYCYAVWSIDALGRPSGRAAADWVQVPAE